MTNREGEHSHAIGCEECIQLGFDKGKFEGQREMRERAAKMVQGKSGPNCNCAECTLANEIRALPIDGK